MMPRIRSSVAQIHAMTICTAPCRFGINTWSEMRGHDEMNHEVYVGHRLGSTPVPLAACAELNTGFDLMPYQLFLPSRLRVILIMNAFLSQRTHC